MEYTPAQYAVMERLARGLIYDSLSNTDQDIVRYLDTQGIAQPRANIEDGYYELSQKGKRVLAAYQVRLEELDKEAEEKTKQKRQQRFENQIAVANLLVPFITFLLGIIAEHYVGIIGSIQWLVHWVKPLWD